MCSLAKANFDNYWSIPIATLISRSNLNGLDKIHGSVEPDYVELTNENDLIQYSPASPAQRRGG